MTTEEPIDTMIMRGRSGIARMCNSGAIRDFRQLHGWPGKGCIS